MHLVSDMAVPAHVRPEYHLTLDTSFTDFIEDPDLYEKWTAKNYKTLNYSGLKPSSAIFKNFNPNNTVEYLLAPEPISALWDQNRYRKILDNPWVTRTGISAEGLANIGLSEYTNANRLPENRPCAA